MSPRFSLWMVLGTGFFTGLLIGLLGIGGSFIGVPAVVYVLGCPIMVAMSTDFFVSLFAVGYGTFSHSLKGNIDQILLMVLFVSTTVGMHSGTAFARRLTSPRTRQVFSLMAYLVVLLLVWKIVSRISPIPYLF